MPLIGKTKNKGKVESMMRQRRMEHLYCCIIGVDGLGWDESLGGVKYRAHVLIKY